MDLDPDRCYRAVLARDARFDGWFVGAVTSTGIYCRPSCPAVTPRRANMRFYATAAAAQGAGFRACKRCRPDAAPGSPEWEVRDDLVARAMRAIGDGAVDRHGVVGLAVRLGVSERHLTRRLTAEVGAGPLALARAQRARTARILIETTDLAFASVAGAAGFASVRQFNDTIREVFAATPTELRRRAVPRTRADGAGRGEMTGRAAGGVEGVALRLPARLPLDLRPTFAHLAATLAPGVESWDGEVYRRSLRLPHGWGVAALAHDGSSAHVDAVLHLADLRDLTTAVARCRRLLDLDADPVAVDAHLATDPALAALVARRPGLRVPRSPDAAELAIRVLVGQQVSVVAARTHLARLVRHAGTPLPHPVAGVTHLFPTSRQIASTEPAAWAAMPATRRDAIAGLAGALARGDLDLEDGAERSTALDALGRLAGVGPWTVQMVALRGLGDPDAFPATDLGVRRAAEALGLPTTPAALAAHAERWRPWRAGATHLLWSTLDLAGASPADVSATSPPRHGPPRRRDLRPSPPTPSRPRAPAARPSTRSAPATRRPA